MRAALGKRKPQSPLLRASALKSDVRVSIWSASKKMSALEGTCQPLRALTASFVKRLIVSSDNECRALRTANAKSAERASSGGPAVKPTADHTGRGTGAWHWGGARPHRRACIYTRVPVVRGYLNTRNRIHFFPLKKLIIMFHYNYVSLGPFHTMRVGAQRWPKEKYSTGAFIRMSQQISCGRHLTSV